jgi:ParB family transcriptional regulator, chromosome partitioning protein
MSALGRGLGSLIPGGIDEQQGEAVHALPITRIRPNPNQPRKVFDTEALEQLKGSIEQHGILQPICVRPVDGAFEIVSGERRWRAARLAGLTEMPVVVREGVTDELLLELALVENVHRSDLDPIEKARAFREMVNQLDMTQEVVAERVGLKRSTVANHLRLLELPLDAQEALLEGLVTMGHARALLAFESEGAILEALERVVREELSVRQTERLARAGLPSATIPAPGVGSGSKSSSKPSTSAKAQLPWAKDIEDRIRRALGVRVKIQDRGNYKGQITLDYSDRDSLQRVVDCLAPRDEI